MHVRWTTSNAVECHVIGHPIRTFLSNSAIDVDSKHVDTSTYFRLMENCIENRINWSESKQKSIICNVAFISKSMEIADVISKIELMNENNPSKWLKKVTRNEKMVFVRAVWMVWKAKNHIKENNRTPNDCVLLIRYPMSQPLERVQWHFDQMSMELLRVVNHIEINTGRRNPSIYSV